MGIYNAVGYYSTTFLLIYYDGYGYNYYYGGYGYYEYSVHPEDTSTRDSIIGIIVGVCCYCILCFFCYRCKKDAEAIDSDDSDQEVTSASDKQKGKKKFIKRLRDSSNDENRPFDPKNAAYPPGFDHTTLPPAGPPPDMPPGSMDVVPGHEVYTGYTMQGVVTGMPVAQGS